MTWRFKDLRSSSLVTKLKHDDATLPVGLHVVGSTKELDLPGAG